MGGDSGEEDRRKRLKWSFPLLRRLLESYRSREET